MTRATGGMVATVETLAMAVTVEAAVGTAVEEMEVAAEAEMVEAVAVGMVAASEPLSPVSGRKRRRSTDLQWGLPIDTPDRVTPR